MRQYVMTILVLMGMALSGWAQEKALIETYLGEVQASTEVMKAISHESNSFMGALEDKLSEDDFDWAGAIVSLGQFEERMRACQALLEEFVVPEEAVRMQELLVEQYQIAISVMSKTGSMLAVAEKLSTVAQTLKEEEADSKQPLLEKMTALEGEMDAILAEVDGLANRATAVDLAVKSEKKRLLVEFDIPESQP